MVAFEWIIWLLYFLESSRNHQFSDGFRGGAELNWFAWTRLILYAKCDNECFLFNVIKHYFGELCGPFKYLFDLSLRSGVFPDLMKTAVVSPMFKTGDTADISNYRPISVLPCFSKILERVMHSRRYKYLTDQKIFTLTTVWL